MQEQNRHIFKIGHVSHNQVFRRWIAVASAIFVLAGCAAPVVEEGPRIKTLTERLNEIETVRLEDQSTSKPISVEQATEEIVEHIKEPNESRPIVGLTLAEVRAAAIANNLDLKVKLVDPSIAQQAVDEARAKFESVFFGSAQHRRTEAVDSTTVSKTDSYEAGIESPLYTGGSITVRSPFSDTESDSADFEGVFRSGS